ncbi:MAG: hypothetical protein HOY79_17855 [Streptomyces sp.]|nr:hypothetical protein [Streptomyces sp.]
MTNTNAIEASVQVLTAEVRTLVIGSRQVTMSVYNQLDDVLPSSIEPFGRVNPKVTNSYLFFYVVGRYKTSGALVRSYVPRQPADLNEHGWVPIDSFTSVAYKHWYASANTAELRRQCLGEVSAQWSALPLIVLAGLR